MPRNSGAGLDQRQPFSTGQRWFWGFLYLGGAIALFVALLAHKVKWQPAIVPMVLDALLFYWGIRILLFGTVRRSWFG